MKIKGDVEERAVLAIVRERGFPGAERTRAGTLHDKSDISLSPGAVIQVKDVKTPNWTEWLNQLADQKIHAQADTGFISWKRSRPGKAPLRLAVLPLDEMTTLLRMAGYGTPLENK
nr:hypothetical protein [Rhodococcus sp. (in: high G+C Gram-positive bacteria)]